MNKGKKRGLTKGSMYCVPTNKGMINKALEKE
jgi:hypothetical protein